MDRSSLRRVAHSSPLLKSAYVIGFLLATGKCRASVAFAGSKHKSFDVLLRRILHGKQRFDPSRTVCRNTVGGKQNSDSPISSQVYSSTSFDPRMPVTLAGPFVVSCHHATNGGHWSLVALNDISDVDTTTYPTDGARAWASLHYQESLTVLVPKVTIRADLGNGSLEIAADTSNIETEYDKSLIAVLSRIFAQWVICQGQLTFSRVKTIRFLGEWTLDIDGTDIELLSTQSADCSGKNKRASRDVLIRRFFEGFDAVSADSELVEMVDRHANLLGVVPRPLVHEFNLLHRGIGLLVTKDSSILSALSRSCEPDLYCHQRAATKRIFPSLYDMFVGGISLAGEDSAATARREVAEELGLSRAISDDSGLESGQLTDRLLRCVVCTGYNRCVVDVFGYTMDTATESIVWQAEEVAWGSFVPYGIVAAAADRSIARLVRDNSWPGQHPAFQSRNRLEADSPVDSAVAKDDATIYDADWENWDFVPDGLLVWEAWTRHAQAEQAKVA
jgi:8-oxo-dGTP pyrophosphatase MutT (NUDIX family)